MTNKKLTLSEITLMTLSAVISVITLSRILVIHPKQTSAIHERADPFPGIYLPVTPQQIQDQGIASDDTLPKAIDPVQPHPQNPRESLKEKVFLLQPQSQEKMKIKKNAQGLYVVEFQFEVLPPLTPNVFTLEHNGKVILRQNLTGSPTGQYRMKVQLKERGLWMWQVGTRRFEGEKREFTLL